jgi:hypothetical protein
MTSEVILKIEMLLENALMELEEAEHYGDRSLDRNLARLGNEKAIQGRKELSDTLISGLKERDSLRQQAARAASKGDAQIMNDATQEANKIDNLNRIKSRLGKANNINKKEINSLLPVKLEKRSFFGRNKYSRSKLGDAPRIIKMSETK